MEDRFKRQQTEQNVKNLTQVWTTDRVNQLMADIEEGIDTKVTPFWDGKPEWRAANIVFEYTPDELDEIKKCASDILYFANKFCFAMTDNGVQHITLRDYQEDMLRDMQDNNKSIILAPRQIGKAQPLDAVVWKVEGKSKFGDLIVGDKIYGSNGQLTNVTGIYPQGVRNVYKITFADGNTVQCCSEHLWTVETVEGKEQTLELQEIIKKGVLTNRGDYKWFVKTAKPVEFTKVELPLDPYLLGLILGDGCISQRYTGYATMDDEILEYFKTNVCEKYNVKLKKNKGFRPCEYVIVGTNRTNKIREIIDELGLDGTKSDTKFIPKMYLYSSIEQRIELLQGLMDTDGFCRSDSNIEYSTASAELADGVQQICESLGMVVRRSTKNPHYIDSNGNKIQCKIAYRLKLQLPNGYPYPVFKLTRKQNNVRDKHYDWGYRRGITKVEFVDKIETQCISVDNKDHLYLTDHFIPTHNTIVNGIFLTWFFLFNADKNLMILSNTGATTVEIIDKIKVIVSNLPFFMKPGIIKNNEMTIKIDNGCRLFGRNTTKTAAVGYALHLCFVDEMAHIHPNFIEHFWRSVYPTLSASKNSRIVISSTPNGMNLFYDIYTAALEHKNEFKAIRIDWWQIPGRDDAWRLKEIANLGSEENFNQEYGNQFLASSKLLLDHKSLEQIKHNTTEFVWRQITALHDMDLNYEHLRWHPKFNIDNIKSTDRFAFIIDTAGGGGGDYTVLNIFKLVPMPEMMINQQIMFKDEGDFMSLLQIGMFRSNKAGIEDLQPILEILLYKIFGDELVKICLEMDFKGNLLYERMSNHINFYEDIFIHTKHSEKSKRLMPGIKLNPKNKYEFCMELRRLIKSGRIIPTEENTFNELMSFGVAKNGTYSSQIGHDDIAMTCVDLVPFFTSDQYYEIVENIYDILDEKYKTLITNKINNTSDEPKKTYDLDFLSGLME